MYEEDNVSPPPMPFRTKKLEKKKNFIWDFTQIFFTNFLRERKFRCGFDFLGQIDWECGGNYFSLNCLLYDLCLIACIYTFEFPLFHAEMRWWKGVMNVIDHISILWGSTLSTTSLKTPRNVIYTGKVSALFEAIKEKYPVYQNGILYERVFSVRFLILMDHAFCFRLARKYSSFAHLINKSPYLLLDVKEKRWNLESNYSWYHLNCDVFIWLKFMQKKIEIFYWDYNL